LKFIQTKFVRAALGILKVTQDNSKEVWRFVPVQDFTSDSEIDWSKSIAEIDQQLYKKYKLSVNEIEFIEKQDSANVIIPTLSPPISFTSPRNK